MTGKYQGSCIFPTFDSNGEMNFFSVRSLTGDAYGLSPWVPKGYKKVHIFNELNVDLDKPLVIVEGFLDMVKSVENTVPLFGSFIAKDSVLFEAIVSHQTPVVLALDPDVIEKTYKIANNFISRGVSVYTVEIELNRDVGKMSKEEFISRYNNAKSLTRESIIRSKLRSLC